MRAAVLLGELVVGQAAEPVDVRAVRLDAAPAGDVEAGFEGNDIACEQCFVGVFDDVGVFWMGKAETVTADSAVVSCEVSWTVYAPSALQACDGEAVVAEAPSPKSQSQEPAGEADVSRSRMVWPATGFGGSSSKVSDGEAPARERRTAAETRVRAAIERRNRRFIGASEMTQADRRREHGRGCGARTRSACRRRSP